MSKALWFVVSNVPHQSAEEVFGEHMPSLDEVRREMQEKLTEIARRPLEPQGSGGATTWRSGPQPRIRSGQADTDKLRIVEDIWKSPF